MHALRAETRIVFVYCTTHQHRARAQHARTALSQNVTKTARNSAAAVIADRTAYDVRYCYRPLSGLAVVGMSIYLFTVSNQSLLLMPVSFPVDRCVFTTKVSEK